MLYRKRQKDILEWYKNSKYALLVSGARQVGKTYLIENTLKLNNIPYEKINLIDQKEFLTMLNNSINKSSKEFFMTLTNMFDNPLKPNSVIFIDEVQECKEIVTMIKFLVENTPYKYILSGSLLGIELNNLRSAPVGYLGYIELFPLDFEEFVIANGIDLANINYLKKCFEQRNEINQILHNKFINLFYKYLVIGGMPQAVQTYIDSNDLNAVRDIQEFIKFTYKKDFTKYEDKNKTLLLRTIYDLVPSELNSKTKRYNFNSGGKGNRYLRYENSINWLIDAGVALPVFNVTEAKIPLEINKKYNLFKLFYSDVGLLTSSYGKLSTTKILDNGQDINCGAIFENAIAQELKTHGFKVYYYNSKKHGEVDFVIEYNNKAYPIEVKSGKDYKSHSALDFLINLNRLDNAFVLSNENIKKKDGSVYYPIYMIMFIDNMKKL